MRKIDFHSAHKALNVLEKLLELSKLVKELTDDEFALILRSLEKTEEELKVGRK